MTSEPNPCWLPLDSGDHIRVSWHAGRQRFPVDYRPPRNAASEPRFRLIPTLTDLRIRVATKEGLASLVTDSVVEHDHLEFKGSKAYDPRDPASDDEVRKDSAGLATAGEGFLIWGIRESEDGQDRAESLDGAPTAAARAFKDRVTNLLMDSIDPPFGPGECIVNLVPLDETRAAVVVHVYGTRGYPKGIRQKREGSFRFVVRVGRVTDYPDQRAVRLKRYEIDHASLIAGLSDTTEQLKAASTRLAELTDDRADRIDERRRHAFVGALKNVSDRLPVELQVFDVPDTRRLGEVVLKLLNHAGWPVAKAMATQLWFPTVDGVHLEVASKSPIPSQAAAMAAALDDLGIGPTRILVPERLPDPGTFRIFVGRRVPGVR